MQNKMSAHSKTCNVNVIKKKNLEKNEINGYTGDLILVMCFYNNLVAFDKYDIKQFILTKWKNLLYNFPYCMPLIWVLPKRGAEKETEGEMERETKIFY